MVLAVPRRAMMKARSLHLLFGLFAWIRPWSMGPPLVFLAILASCVCGWRIELGVVSAESGHCRPLRRRVMCRHLPRCGRCQDLVYVRGDRGFPGSC